MPIKNRDRYPDTGFDFLPDDEIRIVGTWGGKNIVLLGYEKGSDEPIISIGRTNDPASEDLSASPVHDLYKFGYHSPIEFTEDISRKPMKTIHKFPIPSDKKEFQLDLPAGAKILTAEIQQGVAQLWALVNTDQPATPRYFCLIRTGDPIKEVGLIYVNTLMLKSGAAVSHLFEKEVL
ncbi:MAG: hypothetical protein SAK29_17395 [Scytonema sp. PMC 1069.18]|nr:hypothetical protein [Scytonema sp. PMC 1069.18]MEC4882984.1 hypothetical protein [Scytonema sp. PMC 1070.18]